MVELKSELGLTSEQKIKVRKAVEEEHGSMDDVEYIEVSSADKESNKVTVQYKLKNVPKMERIRRVTGYLSPVDRWCDAKKAELRDRVKHA